MDSPSVFLKNYYESMLTKTKGIKLIILMIFMFISIVPCVRFAIAGSISNNKNPVTGIQAPIEIVIAAKNKNDYKFDRGVYLFKIHCALGSCSVERISLDECVNDKIGSLSFTPEIDKWTSWAGFLEANLRDDVLELTIFQRTHRTSIAKIELKLSFLDSKSVQVKSFKATGFENTKHGPSSENLIEYIPLVGDQVKQLSCPVFLPGISSD